MYGKLVKKAKLQIFENDKAPIIVKFSQQLKPTQSAIPRKC